MKKILFLLLAVSIVGCKNSQKKETVEVAKEFENGVKLYQLVGGSILVNKLEIFAQDKAYEGQSKQFTNMYYVISHPKGNLMWDAGLPENLVVEEPFTEISGVFTLQRPDSLANQLETIGFKIEDFNYFAMSHTHFDHTGHANLMKDSNWILQEKEYNYVADSITIKDPALKELQISKAIKINGDYDVFGDGTVVIKSMPGHTIGHQVLYIEVDGLTKPILLTGDLYHFEENRANRGVPSFNYNVQETLESMDAFEAFAKEKNAEVIIQHSPNDAEKLEIILNSLEPKA
ncbi:MAG: N-acyl homoserine lactonase family protein [Polaribacter sp.]|uniref:N-acyl homoserine lactonase family protein n=1 Tax=Polaribacter sp. TaxID=1920175 RepID=UPI003BAFF838